MLLKKMCRRAKNRESRRRQHSAAVGGGGGRDQSCRSYSWPLDIVMYRPNITSYESSRVAKPVDR